MFHIITISPLKVKLLTALFSCDRLSLLNYTLLSFFRHISIYEPNIFIDFYFLDSGSPNRTDIVNEYRIDNVFYMNPNYYTYSYGVFWSYLHGSYVLFLEDDRPFIINIEKKLIYPNYVEEAILVLKMTNDVAGILLKDDRYGRIKTKIINTYLGKHLLCILTVPPMNMYFTNGPAVYKVKTLLKTGCYISEEHIAKVFEKKKWFTGFMYRGLKNRNINKTFTSLCQAVSIHNGWKKSTQKKNRSICTTSYY